MIGVYAVPLGLTKVPDIHMKRTSIPTTSQQSTVASDAEADVCASVEAAETACYPLYKTNTSHSAGTSHTDAGHDQRTSLEMPAIVTSASSINLNFDRKYAKSQDRVHGTSVSNKTAARHAASHRKH